MYEYCTDVSKVQVLPTNSNVHLGADPPGWVGHGTPEPAKPSRAVALRRGDRAGHVKGANLLHMPTAPETSETTAARRWRWNAWENAPEGARSRVAPDGLAAERLGYFVRSICSMWVRLFLCVVSRYSNRWPSLSTSDSMFWVWLLSFCRRESTGSETNLK